ncbi:MAG TPA: succinate dehydrogenase [Candidatus Binatia bacterium]|jgi:succinate dehydrogenase / fumarate reductase cytochrome b subunit
MDRDRMHLLLRRLHSLAGILPIGAYLLAHIFLENSFVLGGPKRFNLLVEAIAQIPTAVLLGTEILVLWAPIIFHGVYGLVILRSADIPNALHYDYTNSYLYVLQRVTGVIAFFFIGFHVYTTRLAYYFYGTEITYDFMHSYMSNPVWFAVYVVGVLSAIFHFTNGIWTFCVTWGITIGAAAQRMMQLASVALFVVMTFTGMAILVAFR